MINVKSKIILYTAYLFTILLISVFSVSCMGMGPFAGEQISDQGIETFEVQKGDIFQIVSTTGSIDSNIQNTYTLQGSGEIISALEKGDSFKKGDILVGLDNSDGMAKLSQMEKDIELSEISLKAAKLNYQNALDSNHIAVQLAEINMEQAEKSTESALTSLESANSNAELSYRSALRALEDAEKELQLAQNDPTITDIQLAQYESKVGSAEDQLESTKISNKSSTSTSESSYDKALISQSSAYWNNLSSSQNAESQIVLTRQSITQAEIQLELAKMDLESAKNDIINNYIIYAPYDGVVLSSDFRAGNQNSGNMVSIVSNDFIIKANIGETDVSKVSTGNEAYITLDAYSDSQFSGKVDKIIPVLTEDSGIINFEIIINFSDSKEFEIFYGFSANIDIVTKKADNVLFVPIQSVYKEGDKSYVDLLLSDEVQPDNIMESISKVEVTTGINDYYYIEITSGLKEGDIVITSRI